MKFIYFIIAFPSVPAGTVVNIYSQQYTGKFVAIRLCYAGVIFRSITQNGKFDAFIAIKL